MNPNEIDSEFSVGPVTSGERLVMKLFILWLQQRDIHLVKWTAGESPELVIGSCELVNEYCSIK